MNDQLQYSLTADTMTESFEDLELSAYQDEAGVWTIGYGHTGPGVHAGMTITKYTAQQLLDSDLALACHAVKSYVTRPLTQGQFDALVDFTFNEGAQHLKESTLLLRVNANDDAAAAEEFMRWVYAGGQVSDGLKRRREAERQLYLTA